LPYLYLYITLGFLLYVVGLIACVVDSEYKSLSEYLEATVNYPVLFLIFGFVIYTFFWPVAFFAVLLFRGNNEVG